MEDFRQRLLNDPEIAKAEADLQSAAEAMKNASPNDWNAAKALRERYEQAEERMILLMAGRLAPESPLKSRVVFSNDRRYSITDAGEGEREMAEDALRSTADALVKMVDWSSVDPRDRTLRVALMNIGGASWYSGEDRKIHMGMMDTPQSRSILCHEFGHWLEDRVLGADADTYELSEERSTAPVQGRYMSDRRLWHFRPDHWPEQYAERVYLSREYDAYPPYTTEVTSVGMEWLMTKPTRLAREDPELFDHVVTLVGGDLNRRKGA